MVNFTKGEWIVEDTFRILDENNRGIAHSLKSNFGEAKANAHLIAAAPEMYEACKIALEFFVAYDIHNKGISGLSLQLREALAKAEGKGRE